MPRFDRNELLDKFRAMVRARTPIARVGRSILVYRADFAWSAP